MAILTRIPIIWGDTYLTEIKTVQRFFQELDLLTPTSIITNKSATESVFLFLACYLPVSRSVRQRKFDPFLAFWIIQKGIFLIFEWSSMGDMTAHMSISFSIIKICNLKSIRCTELKKMAKKHFFGYLDHSKMIFRGFWMIQHVRYGYQIVKDI